MPNLGKRFGGIKKIKMMSDKNLHEFIDQLKDFLDDAVTEFDTDKMEIYATVLAIALSGIRKVAEKNGYTEEMTRDLAHIGIRFAPEDEWDDYFDEGDDVPLGETIH